MHSAVHAIKLHLLRLTVFHLHVSTQDYSDHDLLLHSSPIRCFPACSTRFTAAPAFADASTSSSPDAEAPLVGSVTKLVLYDANANAPIATFDPLNGGAVIDVNTYGTSFSIVAEVTGAVGSIKFALDGNESHRVESVAPYALNGDYQGNYFGWTPSIGSHTIAATPYQYGGANGTAGTRFEVSFTVTDNPASNQPPDAAFTFTTNSLTASFTDQSNDTDGTINSYSWNFGDGNTNDTSNPAPSHTYANGGAYSVTLTVTDDDGAQDSATQDVIVSAGNSAPVANFTFSEGTEEYQINFTSTSSDPDPNGFVDIFEWNFGDGTILDGFDETPSHTYTAAGTYTVRLTVTDNLGLTDWIEKDVVVTSSGGGTGAFLESTGMVVMEAENAQTFTSGSGDSWTQVTSAGGYSGTAALQALPDNGTLINNGYAASSPEILFDVKFSQGGQYWVWVRMWAADDYANSIHAGYDGSETSTAQAMEQTVYNSWQWTKNRKFSTENAYINATTGLHTISIWMREDGVYIDKVLLTDDPAYVPSGQGPTESPRDDAGGNQAPTAAFTFTTDGLTADFESQSSDPEGSTLTHAWNFGDNSNGSNAPVSHTYAASGTYDVTLTVTDDQGASHSTTQQVTVSGGNQPPTASFTVVTTDLTATFTNTSSDPDPGFIQSYAWDFGDGSVSSDTSPSHTYGTSNTYTVELTVTDNDGAQHSVSQSVTVSDGTETGAFLEAGGLLVMEAENAQLLTQGTGGDTWTSVTTAGGFSGAAALQALPNNGTWINDGYSSSSPEMRFDVKFNQGGQYWVWVRMWAAADSDNSVHAGYNGTETSTAKAMEQSVYNSWQWTRNRKDVTEDAYLNVGTGYQSISIWMREDGVYIDKVLLTDNPNYTPSGLGPVESAREGGDPQPNQSPTADFTWEITGGFTVEFTDASTDPDGSVNSHFWDFGDNNTSSEKSPKHTYGGAGTYYVKLTVTDDDGATDELKDVEVTVSEGNLPPSIDITVSPGTTVSHGEAVTFDATGTTDPNGDILTYTWYEVEGGSEIEVASGQVYNHTAAASGDTETIRLKVNDGTLTVSEDVTLTLAAPSTVFYYVKDHLGSIRATVDENGTVVNHSDFYPFGLEMPGRTSVGLQRTRENYTGHELDTETGLVYAGARFLIPEIGRWTAVDPLADEFPSWSPYNYAVNNPLFFADPTGLAACDITICGENGSSVTITTDLIKIEVDAGWLVGDLGGNYTLEGYDILVAALDIIGIADPSGVADGLSATLQASEGDWGGAILSGIGLIPYAGDLGKAPKIGKHLDTIQDAIKTTVIGHNPAYVQLAQKLDANYLDIQMAEWNKLDEAAKWALNRKFLDDAIARGDDFVLATPLDKVRKGSGFENELDYLYSKGYKPSSDGTRLIKGNQ